MARRLPTPPISRPERNPAETPEASVAPGEDRSFHVSRCIAEPSRMSPPGTNRLFPRPGIAGGATSRTPMLVSLRDLGSFPLFRSGRGAIAVTKPANDPLRPNEGKLIDDVASQAGLVLFNVRLIEELRASRPSLVKAQDEERRRLERNIHDGAQQQLVALAVKREPGRDDGEARSGQGRGDARPVEGRSDRRPGEPARPGAGDLPAAARRQKDWRQLWSLRPGSRRCPKALESDGLERATRRRSRRPCTSVASRRCRTSRSTPRRERRRSAWPTGPARSRSR